MSRDWLFEKFELIADLPDAVAKMRELVLHVAVTGRLVPQDGHDEPAASLLESTLRERVKLVAAKKIKSRPTAPVEPDKHLFKVPAGWAWTRLSSVGHELGQKVPDRRFTYIDVGAIDSGKGSISDRVEKLEPGEAPSRARKIVARGTVIYSTVRPYLLNVAIVDQDFDPEAIASTAFGILHPFPGIHRRYLFYWLRSSPFTGYVQAGMKGMAYPAINEETFYSGPIPLPPPAEQHRIVAKVDELMALCDELEARQRERDARKSVLVRAALSRFTAAPTPANLNVLFHPSYTIPPAELRKTILTMAVQGKLVPQDPDDEPAEHILARIASTKLRLQKRGEIGKEKPLEPLQSDSLPFEAPDSWRWARLAEITELITKGSSPKWQGITYVTEPEGILFITSENVGNYELRKLDELKYVSKEFNEIERRSILKRGDILMNLVGASIGRTAAYNLHDGANINQAVALIRVVRETDGVCPRFLLHYLNSPTAIDYMLSSRVVNAQPNISLSDARRFAIPLPPLAEQRQIVAKVEDMLAIVDALEQQLDSSRVAATKLLAALVAELTAAKPNECTIPRPAASKDHSMSSLQGKYFPLVDEPTREDLAALSVEDSVGVRAVATGEFREPRKGEWFLSGSYIEAYRAENDLPTAYHIARLALV